MVDWAEELERIVARIRAYGVDVHVKSLRDGILGTFDGISITTDTHCGPEMSCFVMAHCLGHTVQWSLDFSRFEKLYQDLAEAKVNRTQDPKFLVRALAEFQLYEEEASEYGAELFSGNDSAGGAFSNFARADMEYVLMYHRNGTAPPWTPYFSQWSFEVSQGTRRIEAFQSKMIPPFTPALVSARDVVQA